MRRNRISTRRRSCEARMEYQPLEPRNLLAAITVNTLTDNGDLSDGLISLREAIVATNTNAPFGDAPAGDESGDSIRIDPALAGQTVTLSGGQLFITDDLIIRGFGTTIEAAADIGAGFSSRIFWINTSEEVVLSSLTLENGDATQDRVFERLGGAVRFEGGGTLRLFRSHFTNNSAAFGGAIYAAGGNVYSFESTFSNNTSIDTAVFDPTRGLSSAGGGLYLADQSATAVILASTFDGNVAELGNGGAIFAGDSDQIFVFSTDFTNNTANANASARDDLLVDRGDFGGGAIFTRGFLRVGQSTFSGNSSSDGSGGAINTGGNRFVVAKTSFENNVADASGGAIYLKSGIISKFNNAQFSNNEALSEGGALFVADPFLTPFGEPFDLDEPPSRLEIRSSFFSDNRSQTGGAIFFASSFFEGQAVISETTFIGNSVGERFFRGTGGAIHNTAGKLQIYHSTFEDNEARDQNAGARGGAVYSANGEVEIAFSSFSGNEADFGGAVAIISLSEGAETTIFESNFGNNRAGLPVDDPRLPPAVTRPLGDGGAIFLSSVSNTTTRIIGGLFENNIASDSGGAVATASGVNELVVSPSPNGATRFVGNRALAGDGGAIFNFSTFTNSLTTSIRDAVFSENTARNGGGIFVGGPSEFADAFPPSGLPIALIRQLTLSGAQITENDARVNGGGVFISSDALFINNSSNISSNTATNGADIFEA